MMRENALSFWSEIADHARPSLQSWVSDQLEYLLQLASVAIAYAAFDALRAMGIPGSVLDTLETMDRIAIILVFGLFLFNVVRRAAAATVTAGKKTNVHR